MKDGWPVQAKASGGRHFRGNNIDQNFDTYSTEFTFADGAKLRIEGRTMPGCHNEFASLAHGTKGSAIISSNGHAPCRCRTFRGQNQENASDVVWRWGDPRQEPDPYQLAGLRRGTTASLQQIGGQPPAELVVEVVEGATGADLF